MTTRDHGRDWTPDTPTARALAGAAAERRVMSDADRTPSPSRYREIPLDPDGPNAPGCSARKYIVIDPDAPDAPVCKPRRYIIAPDPMPEGAAPSGTPTAWATALGDALLARFR